mmetsp:Transcript_125587/g.402143  ORF Transcript_125587/g.402143 Transcript_125587/m.402143 type:complete len:410 (-) Transcript_125587:39-1268(-)
MLKVPIVCDTGTGVIKAGFAGEKEPSVMFPNLVGRPMLRYDIGLDAGLTVTDLMVGDDANNARAMLQLNRPIADGKVTDWNDMEAVWEYTWDRLGIVPSEHQVVQTEAAMNPPANRQRIVETMFEKYGFAGVNVSVQAVMALNSQGLESGFVVDSGDGVTHLVPVTHGFVEPAIHGQKRGEAIRGGIGGARELGRQTCHRPLHEVVERRGASLEPESRLRDRARDEAEVVLCRVRPRGREEACTRDDSGGSELHLARQPDHARRRRALYGSGADVHARRAGQRHRHRRLGLQNDSKVGIGRAERLLREHCSLWRNDYVPWIFFAPREGHSEALPRQSVARRQISRQQIQVSGGGSTTPSAHGFLGCLHNGERSRSGYQFQVFHLEAGVQRAGCGCDQRAVLHDAALVLL